MKIKTLNKTLLAAFMVISLAACTNTDSPKTSVAANQEVSESNSDVIDESIKENSQDNKPAEANKVAEKPEENSENKDSKSENKEQKQTTIDVKKQDNKENTKDNNAEPAKEKDSKENQSQSNNDIKYEDRNGMFVSSLVSSQGGARDEQMGLANISNIKIDGETLTTEGTIDYLVDPNSYDNAEEYSQGVYNFKINSDTTFQAVSGMAEPEYFTADEFVEYYKGVKDSGLGLKVEVKNGVVTTVTIAS